MRIKSLQKKYQLPTKIKVDVQEDEGNGFIITFPDYAGCLTYAEHVSEIVDVVNDSLLTYFKVSRQDALNADIVYVPSFKTDRKKVSEFIPYSPYLYA